MFKWFAIENNPDMFLLVIFGDGSEIRFWSCINKPQHKQWDSLNNTRFDGFNVGIFRSPTNLEGQKKIRWIHNINEGLFFFFFFENPLFLGARYTPTKKNIPLAPTNWGHRLFHDFDGRPHGSGSDSKPNHPKVLKASSLLKGGILGGNLVNSLFGMVFFWWENWHHLGDTCS